MRRGDRNGYGPFKIVLAGEGGTGKTSLLTRVKYGVFKKAYRLTIGGDVVFFDMTVNQGTARLMCWDSAGQSQFSYVRQAFYRGMKGFIIVFDITWRASFEAVRTWFYELRRTAPDAPFVLVGSKVDLEPFRQIFQYEAQELAMDLGAVAYIETSAKTGFEINTPFEILTEQLILQYKRQQRKKRLKTS